jgi:hypothetical protein
VRDREAPAVNENFTPKPTEHTKQRQQKLALALAIQAAKADDLPSGKPKGNTTENIAPEQVLDFQ